MTWYVPVNLQPILSSVKQSVNQSDNHSITISILSEALTYNCCRPTQFQISNHDFVYFGSWDNHWLVFSYELWTTNSFRTVGRQFNWNYLKNIAFCKGNPCLLVHSVYHAINVIIKFFFTKLLTILSWINEVAWKAFL